jgi:3-oxoacyl-[acyl-carrier protein] reductase
MGLRDGREMQDGSARTALVTGASRGIGKAIASELTAVGWDVLTPSRREMDLSAPESVERFCARLQSEARVDALINNAGINVLDLVTDIQDDDWSAMLQVNVTAPRKLIQAVSAGMVSRRWGRIVNISSVFSLVSRSGRSAYSTTKAAINGFTRAAAIELGPEGILVNAVCPGYVETDLTYANNSQSDIEAIQRSIPLRRLAAPEEIARLVAFLCSDANSYLTGQTIIADGGFTCL